MQHLGACWEKLVPTADAANSDSRQPLRARLLRLTIVLRADPMVVTTTILDVGRSVAPGPRLILGES